MRGFNQSSLIATHISKELGLKIDEDILVRKKDSSHQSQATFEERVRMKDVFELNKVLKNKEIILIDDVISTGTTLNRAAQTLKGNSINAIALFRGRPRYQ
jgi:predicted amidophosphoribosyltransferase